MKLLIACGILLWSCLLTSCQLVRRESRPNLLRQHIRDAIPDGRWATVDAIITGKFTSTTIKGTDVIKDGDNLTARDLHIRHSNPWIPLIQIDTTGFAAPTL